MERWARPWSPLIRLCHYSCSICCFQNSPGKKQAPSPIFTYTSDIREHLSTPRISLSLPSIPLAVPGKVKGLLCFSESLAVRRDANFLLYEVPSLSPRSFLAALSVGLKETLLSFTRSAWGTPTVLPTKPAAHYLSAQLAFLCGLWMSQAVME